MPPGISVVRGGAVVVIALLAGVACRDADVPPVAPTRPASPPAQRVVLSPDDTTWNSFTTEVGVLVNGDYPNWGIVEPTASRSFGFTIVRTALGTNNWANVLTFDPTTPRNLTPDAGDYETDVGRLEFDDLRTYSRLYARSGLLISTVSPDTSTPLVPPGITPPARDTGIYPRHPVNPGAPMPVPRIALGNPAAAASRRASGAGREWIDFHVIGKQGAARLRAQLAAASTVSVNATGEEEFRMSAADEELSITLDRGSGGLRTLVRSRSGRPTMSETREYAPFGPDAHSLARSTIAYYDTGGVKPSRVMQLQFVNTRLWRAEP